MYSHNASTLLASKRRSVYYPPTGTGRDTYIMTDNGGTNIKYTCQGVPELGNYMKFGPLNRSFKPASNTKFQKYVSDGTGRDKYVVKTMRDGGEWRKQPLNNVTQSSWRSMSAMKKEDEMRRTQRSLTNKLSVPKRLTQKYEQKLMMVRNQHLLSLKKKGEEDEVDMNNEEVEV